MSQRNVEIVRSFYAALDRFFDSYWRDPKPLAPALEMGTASPELKEMLSYEHPDIEWQPWSGNIFGTFRGHLELVQAWDDWLVETEDYRVKLEEASDLAQDHVLAVASLDFTAKTTKLRVSARVFTLYTLRDGMIVRVAEYGERKDALQAAGLSEQDALP
jgi:ketosteroid isomerase-like protein